MDGWMVESAQTIEQRQPTTNPYLERFESPVDSTIISPELGVDFGKVFKDRKLEKDGRIVKLSF
jgi:hypothetical protein